MAERDGVVYAGFKILTIHSSLLSLPISRAHRVPNLFFKTANSGPRDGVSDYQSRGETDN